MVTKQDVRLVLESIRNFFENNLALPKLELYVWYFFD